MFPYQSDQAQCNFTRHITLRGAATRWLRFHPPFLSWDNFVAALPAEFLPVAYEYRVRCELDARSQHPDEDFAWKRNTTCTLDRTMKKTVSLGLILFMVIPGNALSSPSTGKQSAHNKLNLTEEVHKYTKNYIGKDIVYYSLKDKPENGESPTLTAKAGQLAFGNGCEKRLSTTKECSDLYMFYIYNGTITPFNLTIDLTLSYKGRRNNFVVDINDASYIYWNPDNITMYPNDTTNYSEEKCNFTCEVSLHGSFAYEVKETIGPNQEVSAGTAHAFLGVFETGPSL
ncbi:hypothetical protein MTO96_003305 [Rhipicephalus appendiculatus]